MLSRLQRNFHANLYCDYLYSQIPVISNGSFLTFQGGFARVYLMTDVSNGNQYACKIIPKNRMQKIHMQKVGTC